MLSVAPERRPAPVTLEALTMVDLVARELRLDYFVTGATARDIVLYGVFDIDTGRATLDVDLGIVVDSWSQFDEVKTRLVDTSAFAADASLPHRLSYVRSAGRGYPLDLIPFGRIERGASEIAWPPDLSIVMNVAGYRDALAAASEVNIQPGLVMRVASLPGLAVLKVFAWADRGAEDPRDALDLATLLSAYWDAGNRNRLYDEELELLETLAYDPVLAGAQLIGKDAAQITAPTTRMQVLAVLDDEVRFSHLVRDTARALRPAEDPIAQAENLLRQFRTGFREA